MRKILLLVFCIAIGIGAQPMIAVTPLVSHGLLEDEALSLTDALRSTLGKTNKFKVMERTMMEEILKEQGFQKSGACDETSCAISMGQVLAVKYMVLGSVGKVGRTYTINVRMVDIGTSSIIKDVTKYNQGEVDGLLINAIPLVVNELCADTAPQQIPLEQVKTNNVITTPVNNTNYGDISALRSALDNKLIVCRVGNILYGVGTAGNYLGLLFEIIGLTSYDEGLTYAGSGITIASSLTGITGILISGGAASRSARLYNKYFPNNPKKFSWGFFGIGLGIEALNTIIQYNVSEPSAAIGIGISLGVVENVFLAIHCIKAKKFIAELKTEPKLSNIYISPYIGQNKSLGLKLSASF